MSSSDSVLASQFHHAKDYAKRLGFYHAMHPDEKEVEDQFIRIDEKAARWWREAYESSPTEFNHEVLKAAREGFEDGEKEAARVRA